MHPFSVGGGSDSGTIQHRKWIISIWCFYSARLLRSLLCSVYFHYRLTLSSCLQSSCRIMEVELFPSWPHFKVQTNHIVVKAPGGGGGGGGGSGGQQGCLASVLITDISNGTLQIWRWALCLRQHTRPFINMPLRRSNTSIHLLYLHLLPALSPFLALHMPLSPGICVV